MNRLAETVRNLGIERLFTGGVAAPAMIFVYLAVSTVGGYFLTMVLGMKITVVALVGAVFVGLLVLLSMRDLSLALVIWLISMGSFRSIGMVAMPGLPDFSIDRIMLVWIVLVLLARVLFGQLEFHKPYGADLLVIGHVVYIWAQMQTHSDFSHFHQWVLSSLSPAAAFFYGKYVVRDERYIRNILLFLFATTVYYYVTAIAEHFSINALVWPKNILDPNVGFWAKGRSRGPVLHPPLFGQILSMMLLVHFYFLLKIRRWPLKIAMGISLLLALLGVFFAYTRGPWVALGVAIVVLAVARPGYRRIVGAIGVIVVIAGIFGLLKLANSDFLQERLGSENTVENRLGFMANAWRMVRDHPIFGIGYFRFLREVSLYNQSTYIPFYGLVRKGLGAHVAIHDIFLGPTAEVGIVGTTFMFWFYYLILRSFRSLWRRAPQGRWFNRDLLALFFGITVCYFVGGMAIDYRYFDFINVLFYLIAGIVYGVDGRMNRVATVRAVT